MVRLKKYMTILIMIILLLAGIFIMKWPGGDYSENENRYLQTKPVWSMNNLLVGTYQTELTDFLTDHFPARNLLMAVGTAVQKAMGRTDIGGAYIGKDNYYFEKVTAEDIDAAHYEKNLVSLEKLAENYQNISFKAFFVPSSETILSSELPDYAAVYDAEALYQTAAQMLTHYQVIDPREQLQADVNEQIYYKTDHHWTTKGAYVGYQALMRGNGACQNPKYTVVSDTFLGTLYSKTLDWSAKGDEIVTLQINDKLQVKKDGVEATIYDEAALSEKDKYKVFFGGNYGNIEITGGSGTGTLLIIKDSFANCMVPFLTADYAMIQMIDLRYYAGSVKALLKDENIDDVLVLYELNNFANDSNLAKLAL